MTTTGVSSSYGPCCLVRQRKGDDRLEVAEEGLRCLTAGGAASNAPARVLCVAGTYRTGKSYLLSRLQEAIAADRFFQGGQMNGNDPPSSCSNFETFSVGSTTEACTRGIWVWSHVNARGELTVLLDTEGLASVDNDETWDAKIFSLGILLCSYFLYNSVGVVDEAAIDRLFLVGELTKHIALSGSSASSSSNNTDLAHFFPPFMWVLRDFSLRLEREGREITPKEYLDDALGERPGNSARIRSRNEIRRAFRTLFRDRSCVTLVRPVHEEEDLRILSTLDSSRLRPEFVSQLHSLFQQVFASAGIKTVFGDAVTGAMLVSLVNNYVGAINGGAVPDLRKSYEYMVEESLRHAFQVASAAHRASIDGAVEASISKDAMLSTKAFDAAAAASRADSILRFESEGGAVGFGTDGGASETARAWRDKLEGKLAEQREAALENLTKSSMRRCKEILNEIVDAELKSPLMDGAFSLPDSRGYAEKFASACTQVLELYQKRASGPCKAFVCAQLLPSATHALWTRVAVLADTYHTETNQRLSQERDRLKKENASQSETISGLSADLNDARRRVQETEVANAKLASKLEARDATIQELRISVSVLQSDLKNAQHRIQETDAANADMRATIQDKNQTIQDLRVNVSSLDSDLKHSMAEVEQMKARFNDLQDSSSATIRDMQQKQTKCMADLEAFAKLIEDSYAREAAMMERGAEERQRAASALEVLQSQLDQERAISRRTRQEGWIRSCLTDVVHEVELRAQQDESAKHTARLMEEKCAIQERLADFFLRASTLPDIYQATVFCSDAGLVSDW